MRKLAEINFLFMQDYRQAVFIAIARDTAWFGFGKNEENDKNGKNDKKFLAIGEKVKPESSAPVSSFFFSF